MTISTIEESELPESMVPFTVYHCRSPADSVGQVVISAAGHHPKCRLVRANYIAIVYSTAVDVLAIERGSGEDVATVSGAAVTGTPAAFTIAPAAATKNSFERNEDIAVNLTTDGNAANSGLALMTFENIH